MFGTTLAPRSLAPGIPHDRPADQESVRTPQVLQNNGLPGLVPTWCQAAPGSAGPGEAPRQGAPGYSRQSRAIILRRPAQVIGSHHTHADFQPVRVSLPRPSEPWGWGIRPQQRATRGPLRSPLIIPGGTPPRLRVRWAALSPPKKGIQSTSMTDMGAALCFGLRLVRQRIRTIRPTPRRLLCPAKSTYNLLAILEAASTKRPVWAARTRFSTCSVLSRIGPSAGADPEDGSTQIPRVLSVTVARCWRIWCPRPTAHLQDIMLCFACPRRSAHPNR